MPRIVPTRILPTKTQRTQIPARGQQPNGSLFDEHSVRRRKFLRRIRLQYLRLGIGLAIIAGAVWGVRRQVGSEPLGQSLSTDIPMGSVLFCCLALLVGIREISLAVRRWSAARDQLTFLNALPDMAVRSYGAMPPMAMPITFEAAIMKLEQERRASADIR